MSALEIAQLARSCLNGDGLARVVRERSVMLRFAANRPTQSTAIDDVTVELAVVRGGHVGRAATNRIDRHSLSRCARRATEAARLASTAGPGGHPGLAVEPARDLPGGALDSDPSHGAAALETAFSIGRRAGLEAHGIWTAGTVEHAVADENASNEERTTDSFFKVICIDAARDRSGYAVQAARNADSLNIRRLCEEAARKASLDGPVAELPSGEYPVVFEHSAVGLLLDALGSSALNGLAHAEGRGALVGRLGRQLAAPAVNLADSPAARLTLPRSFDAEGTAKRPLPLIQDGVVNAVVHDRRSAALAGARVHRPRRRPGRGPARASPGEPRAGRRRGERPGRAVRPDRAGHLRHAALVRQPDSPQGDAGDRGHPRRHVPDRERRGDQAAARAAPDRFAAGDALARAGTDRRPAPDQ